MMTGPDSLYPVGLGDLSYAPGNIQDGQRYRFGQLQFNAGDFSFLALYQQRQKQSFFGAVDILPPAVFLGDSYSDDSANWLLRAGTAFSLSSDLQSEIRVTLHEGTSDSDQWLAPAGAPALLIGPPLSEDLYQEIHTKSRRLQVDALFEWTGWQDHQVRVEFSMAKDEMLDAYWAFNFDLLTFQSLPYMRRYSGEYNFIDPKAERTIKSVVVQDQWSPREDLDLTLGVRYDDYSDVEDSLSHPLAAVWSLTDHHIIKAQLAVAFFPPSLLQRHVQSFLPVIQTARDPETIRTAEVGYIFRRPDVVARATAYYSHLNDLITVAGSSWTNLGKARSQGLELEWEQHVGNHFKLNANLSYNDSEEYETGGPIPGAATWLGNLNLFYHPADDVVLAFRWNLVGERARASEDSRGDLPGYNDVSLTLSWFDVATTGLDVRLGVTNLLGENIRSPAPALTYAEDYPLTDERSAWLQLSYDLD